MDTDLDDPVGVTGYRIGDPVDYSRSAPEWVSVDGRPAAPIPRWFAVSRGDVVIGYVQNDLPPRTDAAGRPVSPIFDADGREIGHFSGDGFPVLFTDEVASDE